MAKKSLARALGRKMGEEQVLPRIESPTGDVSLLMNPSRRKLFEYICNYPCSHLRLLSRDLGFSPQTAKWHLTKLVDAQLVSESILGGKKIFKPLAEFLNTDECRVISLLKNMNARRVYITIGKRQGMSQRDLCDQLGLYQQKLSVILLKLQKVDLIVFEKKGRMKVYFPTNRLSDMENILHERSEEFVNRLLLALTADSLEPIIQNHDSESVSLSVHVGEGERSVMRIRLNPISTLMAVEK